LNIKKQISLKTAVDRDLTSISYNRAVTKKKLSPCLGSNFACSKTKQIHHIPS